MERQHSVMMMSKESMAGVPDPLILVSALLNYTLCAFK